MAVVAIFQWQFHFYCWKSIHLNDRISRLFKCGCAFQTHLFDNWMLSSMSGKWKTVEVFQRSEESLRKERTPRGNHLTVDWLLMGYFLSRERTIPSGRSGALSGYIKISTFMAKKTGLIIFTIRIYRTRSIIFYGPPNAKSGQFYDSQIY